MPFLQGEKLMKILTYVLSAAALMGLVATTEALAGSATACPGMAAAVRLDSEWPKPDGLIKRPSRHAPILQRP